MGWGVVVSESPVVEAQGAPAAGRRHGAVLIIGRGTNIAFHLDEDTSLDQVAVELDRELAGHGALFSEGGVTVNTGKRSLSEDQEEEIRRIFREKSGLKISRFVSADSPGAASQPVEIQPPPQPPVELPKPRIDEPPVKRARQPSTPLAEFSSADLARALSGLSYQGQRNRDQALVVRSTIRSGESVSHNGDLIVLGDVNPGSEVVAEGDIVVLGSLKGLPHAGASGDSKAAVIALEIAAPRIRIGNCEANFSPADEPAGTSKRKTNPPDSQPKIAYVRRGIIYVSPFAGRFARYTKGVPYEG